MRGSPCSRRMRPAALFLLVALLSVSPLLSPAALGSARRGTPSPLPLQGRGAVTLRPALPFLPFLAPGPLPPPTSTGPPVFTRHVSLLTLYALLLTFSTTSSLFQYPVTDTQPTSPDATDMLLPLP